MDGGRASLFALSPYPRCGSGALPPQSAGLPDETLRADNPAPIRMFWPELVDLRVDHLRRRHADRR